MKREIDYENIDKSIRSQIKLLNENGYKTIFSCSGIKKDHSRRFIKKMNPLYIAFDTITGRKLEVLAIICSSFCPLQYHGAGKYQLEIWKNKLYRLNKIMEDLKSLSYGRNMRVKEIYHSIGANAEGLIANQQKINICEIFREHHKELMDVLDNKIPDFNPYYMTISAPGYLEGWKIIYEAKNK